MAYVISATYRVKPGAETAVETALIAMREMTAREPACRVYEVHRSLEDPQVFFLYEQYDDEAGFQAHVATDYFTQHIKEAIWPRLERRERVIGQPLGAGPES